MFRCIDITNELLANLYEDAAVSEVIIVDNTEDPNNSSKLITDEKLKIQYQGKNIYTIHLNLKIYIIKE